MKRSYQEFEIGTKLRERILLEGGWGGGGYHGNHSWILHSSAATMIKEGGLIWRIQRYMTMDWRNWDEIRNDALLAMELRIILMNGLNDVFGCLWVICDSVDQFLDWGIGWVDGCFFWRFLGMIVLNHHNVVVVFCCFVFFFLSFLYLCCPFGPGWPRMCWLYWEKENLNVELRRMGKIWRGIFVDFFVFVLSLFCFFGCFLCFLLRRIVNIE